MKINKMILLALMCVQISACTAYGKKNTDAATPGFIACEEPRPQICTNEYNPVCASLKDGITRTDATGCTACSDPQVTGYKMGAC